MSTKEAYVTLFKITSRLMKANQVDLTPKTRAEFLGEL